jgi:hypothetical protein
MTTPNTLSLPLSKRLYELGYRPKESAYWWNGNREYVRQHVDGNNEVWTNDDKLTWVLGRCRSESPACEERFPAPTTDELLEILHHEIEEVPYPFSAGKGLRVYKDKESYTVGYYGGGFDERTQTHPSLPEALGMMLEELAEQKIITLQ